MAATKKSRRRKPTTHVNAVTTTIAIADDHPLVRDGLRAVLGQQPDFTIVGEADTGPKALDLVTQLHPDVLVLDIRMPGATGLDVLKDIARLSPHTRVLMLSMFDSHGYVNEALAAGAAGYLLKNVDSGNVVTAIREIVAGRRYLSHVINAQVINDYVRRMQGDPLDPYETLTARERQVLRLATAGSTTAEIAQQIGISLRTAEHHRANLMRKLKLHTVSDLIQYARQRGLIPDV